MSSFASTPAIIAAITVYAPARTRVAVPYEVIGADEVRLDCFDPFGRPQLVPPRGVIRAEVENDPQTFRIEAFTSSGRATAHTVVIEGWLNDWAAVAAPDEWWARSGLLFPRASRLAAQSMRPLLTVIEGGRL